MRRRGFTLVELLIIVAIIGALAATMMVSTGSSIASAKASAIAHNLRACTTGSQVYYMQHESDTETLIGSVTCATMLADAVPNYTDFGDGNIKYTPEGAGPDNWTIKVEITGTDATDVVDALTKIKGFSSATTTTVYEVFVGKVQAASGGGGDAGQQDPVDPDNP